MRRKKAGNAVLTVCVIAGLAVAAIAAVKLITTQLEYKQADDEYNNIEQVYVEADEGGDAQVLSAYVTEKGGDGSGVTGVPISVDLAALQAQYPDVVGWLYVGAEGISYPIAQSEDNNYYLRRTLQGTYNFAGTIFMDFHNNSDFSSPNTILYGHNMKNGSMFGMLKFLYEGEGYKKDDNIWVITADGAYQYRIFNLAYTNTSSTVYTLFGMASEEVSEWISEQIASSPIEFPLEAYDENSKVITLSTCTSTSSSARFVAQGIMEKVWDIE